jgi:RNA polymerase sigma-70 factor (ECF subfamily)
MAAVPAPSQGGPAPPVPTDAELVARAQAGDLTAFDELDKRHRRKLVGHVAKMLKSAQEDVGEAEGLVQTALIKGRDELPKFRGKSSFYTWLYRIATNGTLDWLGKRGKKAKTEVSVDATWAQVGSEDPAPVQESAIELAGPQAPAKDFELHQHYLNYVRDAKERLPLYLKEVFLLYVAEFPDKDVACVLEVTEATVREYKARIRRILSTGKAGAQDA